MESKTLKTLEFDKILAMLASFAKNDGAKALAKALVPISNVAGVEQMLCETDSAVTLILKYGSPEIMRLEEIGEVQKRLAVGGGL